MSPRQSICSFSGDKHLSHEIKGLRRKTHIHNACPHLVDGTRKQASRKVSGRSGGDVRLWVGIDADSKFVASWRIGQRDLGTAYILSSTTEVIQGDPDPKHISMSYVERLNWSLRTSVRRYTRLSNGFSRKLRNHEAAVALNYFAYNFVRIHRTLRVTPAMAAGVTTRLWDVADIVEILQASESEKAA